MARTHNRRARGGSGVRTCLGWAVLSVALILLPRPSLAGDSSLRWSTMVTPNFRVHFHQRAYRFALRTARIAEEVHRQLTRYTRYHPGSPTHIVVYDDTDSANGSARVRPYNIITVFTSPPAPVGALGDSDDWLRGLLVHEYTHILHLDTVGGIARLLNRILGKTYTPNDLQPQWFVEGWATFAESHFTGGGRMRSSYWEMLLRGAVLGGRMPSLAAGSHYTLGWPWGHKGYLFGSFFLHWIAQKYGKEKLTEVSHQYGGRFIPFGMNTTAKAVIGKTYHQLWADWKRALGRRFAAVKRRVRRAPLTPARMLTSGGGWLGAPRYGAGGRTLVYARADGHRVTRLEEVTRSGRRIRRISRVNNVGQLGVDRSGRFAVVEQTEVHRQLKYYRDLYRVDLASGRSKRLTRGARSGEPDLSPDGRLVVYVKRYTA